jgi:hypothetical protein
MGISQEETRLLAASSCTCGAGAFTERVGNVGAFPWLTLSSTPVPIPLLLINCRILRARGNHSTPEAMSRSGVLGRHLAQ